MSLRDVQHSPKVKYISPKAKRDMSLTRRYMRLRRENFYRQRGQGLGGA
jgi:hypothetical protein